MFNQSAKNYLFFNIDSVDLSQDIFCRGTITDIFVPIGLC